RLRFPGRACRAPARRRRRGGGRRRGRRRGCTHGGRDVDGRGDGGRRRRVVRVGRDHVTATERRRRDREEDRARRRPLHLLRPLSAVSFPNEPRPRGAPHTILSPTATPPVACRTSYGTAGAVQPLSPVPPGSCVRPRPNTGGAGTAGAARTLDRTSGRPPAAGSASAIPATRSTDASRPGHAQPPRTYPVMATPSTGSEQWTCHASRL